MAIQTGPGNLRIDADDPQITHRGKTVAIKTRVISWPVVIGCVNDGNGWKVGPDLTGDLFSTDVPGGGDPVAYHMAGDPLKFVRNVILPNLNAWLATVWTPQAQTGGTGAPVPDVKPIDQLQYALGLIRFVVKPDGTVKAEA